MTTRAPALLKSAKKRKTFPLSGWGGNLFLSVPKKGKLTGKNLEKIFFHLLHSVFHQRLHWDHFLRGSCSKSPDPNIALYLWSRWFTHIVIIIDKHYQRHNGPEGWVRLINSHITSSNTKFDQISSSEYWPSTNFEISTSANISISTKLKIQDIDQTWLRNLD